jgi:enamine deaminase RidA (YjgF/YER057c/UK114 family)
MSLSTMKLWMLWFEISGKWMPDHQPLWTCAGVPRLGEDDTRVEIEVWAHVPEGGA